MPLHLAAVACLSEAQLWDISDPVKDRYLLTSSWYGGGADVIDFTDPPHASEIGYYDVESPNQGSFWAAYWYNGFIYGSDIPNGFDSFLFSGPQRASAQRLGHLNPQTQETYLR